MNVTELEQQAGQYFACGSYQEAADIYEQCIALHIGSISNYWYLGLALLLQGEEIQAQAVWLSAFAEANTEQIDGFTAELIAVLETQASQFIKLGKLELAETIYWQILELNSTPQTYSNLALILLNQQKIDQAIACLEKAIELDSQSVEKYEQLAVIYGQINNFEAATNAYKKALEIQPDQSKFYYKIGYFLTKQNKLEEAGAFFEKAIQIQPNFTQAYSEWGEVLLAQGLLNQGIACLKKAIQLNPNFVNAYCRWSEKLKTQEKLTQIEADNSCFMQALLCPEDQPELYIYIGNKYASSKHYQEAYGCYQKALNIAQNHPNLYLKLGKAFAKIEQPESAQLCLEKAIKLQPNFPDAKLELEKLLTKKSLEVNAEKITFPGVEPPKGFYELTSDWAVASQLETTNYIKLNSQHEVWLREPRKTIYESVPFFLQNARFLSPETFVATLPNGRAWVTDNAIATISPDNLILGELSPYFPISHPAFPAKDYIKNHPIFRCQNLPLIYKIDGTVALIPALSGVNYFHWMTDILPSLGVLLQSNYNLEEIDAFIINGYENLPFQNETLKAAGIPFHKILTNHHQQLHIEAKRLIVPSLAGHLTFTTQWATQFLRNLLNCPLKSQAKHRLYISRKNTQARRVINEDEVINFLEQFGFETIYLEVLSLAEQVCLLASAEVVISPHGAGLTNILFCQPKTKIIEIFTKNFVWPYYWVISNQLNLDYYYLISEGFESIFLSNMIYQTSESEDILISLDALLKLLKIAGIAS